tara:strand:- start:1251 stop:1424 length:174 start_codon:yes stop_codon:yes gene_type:complete
MQLDLFINTPINGWWDMKVGEVGVGELVRRGDALARYAMDLLVENNKLNLDRLNKIT